MSANSMPGYTKVPTTEIAPEVLSAALALLVSEIEAVEAAVKADGKDLLGSWRNSRDYDRETFGIVRARLNEIYRQSSDGIQAAIADAKKFGPICYADISLCSNDAIALYRRDSTSETGKRISGTVPNSDLARMVLRQNRIRVGPIKPDRNIDHPAIKIGRGRIAA